jgi:hypothetical protein
MKHLKRRGLTLGDEIEVQTTDDQWHWARVNGATVSISSGTEREVTLTFGDGEVITADPDDINWRRVPT